MVIDEPCRMEIDPTNLIRSEWKKAADQWRYVIETPVDAYITIADKTYEVEKGTHTFLGQVQHWEGLPVLLVP